ncbi:family 78 glycoside hydrolase catalytic domain [Pedobacter sp. AW31-3R]|uniref:family 78 glycoside hydrolase catalytic domain n=1 Tax=Pedobacter sp. AW31-3R TaxID=3445781 RepID=UPI003F9EEA1D
MRSSFLILSLLLVSLTGYSQLLKSENLRCEYKINPVGIENAEPRLSWELVSDQRNVLQEAYHILVSDNPALLKKNIGNIWDSRKVSSSGSIQVVYKGKPLSAAKMYYWKVMVWDNLNHSSGWSSVQQWQTGLFSQKDWKGARWIAYEVMADSARILPSHEGKRDKNGGTNNDVLPLLRKEISIKKKISRATFYISGLGHFELRINGRKVGDHFLDPGWTNYEKQALYVPFDVTNELKSGKNALGVMLGNGFYYIPKQKKRFRKLLTQYGYPKMICRLQINYNDGSSEDMISNESWKSAPGPLTFSSIYGGEDYDATKEKKGWDLPGFGEAGWKRCIITNGPPQLNAQAADPLKVFEVFQPQQITEISNRSRVYDLGQNSSGIIRISVKGKKGDTVRVTPSELLNTNGTVTQKATGSPFYFTYILKGDGLETWEPRFTYYGFRYLQVDGLQPVAISGLHTRNAAEQAGAFRSDNVLFNKTATLIDWAIRSNMASIFTDCPHREKLGWLEELHLMGSSVRYNYQVQNLLGKSIKDMEMAQVANGLIPEISPEFTVFTWGGDMFRDSPEWGSSSVIVPWYFYEWYGDKKILSEAYPMMKKYISYLQSKAQDHILSQGLGDWYDLGPNPPGVSQLTPMGVTGTAIYYYNLNIMQKIAAIMGQEQDIVQYKKMAEEVKLSFNKKFFDAKTNNYGGGSQTANAMAVYMQLVSHEDKKAVVANIVADIKKRNSSLTSGDIGYRYLLRVLEDEGYSDLIYEMNSRDDVPGYGYQLAHGATALTESWQALPTVSNNHFMLGHLLEWFYSGLGGIRQEEKSVAFKAIKIHPEVVKGVNSAETSYHSPYGQVATAWKNDDGAFDLSVAIPANTTSTIYLPAAQSDRIYEGNQLLDQKNVVYENGRAVISAGSGKYRFKVLKK